MDSEEQGVQSTKSGQIEKHISSLDNTLGCGVTVMIAILVVLMFIAARLSDISDTLEKMLKLMH